VIDTHVHIHAFVT